MFISSVPCSQMKSQPLPLLQVKEAHSGRRDICPEGVEFPVTTLPQNGRFRMNVDCALAPKSPLPILTTYSIGRSSALSLTGRHVSYPIDQRPDTANPKSKTPNSAESDARLPAETYPITCERTERSEFPLPIREAVDLRRFGHVRHRIEPVITHGTT